MRFNKQIKSNVTGEWETTGVATLTEEEAKILNGDLKDSRYLLAEENEVLVSWDEIEGVMIPTLEEGITISKMTLQDLRDNFPQIKSDNVKDFRAQVLATYENLK